MQTQADTRPTTLRIPPEERVRTCRPAVTRPGSEPDPDDGPGAQAAGDWNIVRGED